MGGGKGGGSTTSTQNTSPWAGQQPYLEQQYANSANLYNHKADYPQLYAGALNGSEISPLNSTENNAINQLGNIGTNGSTALSSANNALTNYANGNMLSASNPYFQNVAAQTASQITPQLEAGFTGGNDMNNPGAAYAVSNGVSNAVGNLAYQNYNQQSQNQITASNDAASNYYAQLQGGANALSAGETGQQQSQNVLNSQIGAFNYNQQLPYQMLDQYITQTSGNPGSASTSTSPYYSNTGGNLLSGAAAGAGLSTALGGSAGLGAGGGALLALLSDKRLKTNIKRCGTMASGLPIYEFEYLWGGKHIGVMADEVEHVIPEAIFARPFGISIVNYSRIY